MQNNLRKIWATLDLSLVVIKGNLCHYYSALSVFPENMGYPQPIKFVIVKKRPKLLRVYSFQNYHKSKQHFFIFHSGMNGLLSNHRLKVNRRERKTLGGTDEGSRFLTSIAELGIWPYPLPPFDPRVKPSFN